MPVISDSISDADRAQLGRIAEPEPVPTRREREAKRDAAVEVSGHLDWKGQRCLPCSRCGIVHVASSLRTLHTPGAGNGLVCRTCQRAALDALGYKW